MADIPSLWLEFDQFGAIDAGAATRLTILLDEPGVEDLVIMTHGWMNDKADATEFYGTLWTNVCNNFPAGKAGRIVVAGVQWPAKSFRTDFDVAALASAPASGTLATPGDAKVADLPEHDFEALLTEFNSFMGASGAPTIDAARMAAKGLTASASHTLVNLGAAAVAINPKSLDLELARDALPIARAQGEATNAQLLLAILAQPPLLKLAPTVGTAMGLGSAVQGLIAGSRAAVGRFLNLLTYYEMKKRAGIVGESLANSVLGKLTTARSIRLHLVGHSFGGRLVTAAANQLAPTKNLELFSLTILQGAYSHNALSGQIKPGLAGAFPSVIGKPTGPIVITHTHNDLACTIAYALASRLSRDITQGIGDATDEFGAMGANGPQNLEPGTAESDDVAQVFSPKRRKVNTFLADQFIIRTEETDAHNNVANPAVGRLLAKALLA
ncbi:hypothetical protein [Bradyrhizobium diazoefficiens]